jgi:hypothetical protein
MALKQKTNGTLIIDPERLRKLYEDALDEFRQWVLENKDAT